MFAANCDSARGASVPRYSSDELLGLIACNVAKASRSSDKRRSTNRNSTALKLEFKRP
jgi:hypothetical protein